MCKLIIAGHGSYGTSIRRSLHMIFGETEGIFFIDFTEEDSADTLRQKLEGAVSQCGADPIPLLLRHRRAAHLSMNVSVSPYRNLPGRRSPA